jgi:hypothetical protein
VAGRHVGKSNQSAGIAGDSLGDVVVGLDIKVEAFPGEAADHGPVDAAAVHLLDELAGARHRRFWGAVKASEPLLALKMRFPVGDYLRREDMSMKIYDHRAKYKG